MSEYNAQYFIDKFEKIPSWRWLGWGRFLWMKDAFGHCGLEWEKQVPEEAKALGILLDHKCSGICMGCDERYQQKNPKQRILAALRELQGGAEKTNATIEALGSGKV